MEIRTVDWDGEGIVIVDQSLLPGRLSYLRLKDVRSLWKAIRELKVRGAPALGAAAALGTYAGIKDFRGRNFAAFAARTRSVTAYIASSRPTARNLFYALERMNRLVAESQSLPVRQIQQKLLGEAVMMMEEDRKSCRAMADFGSTLVRNGDTVLTICNTGALATIDYGTALGILFRSHEQGKRIKVFACETRPLLQGARLTAWELQGRGIDCTLICDSMAAAVMKRMGVDSVFTGADRIAANGDTANKIGTYGLAVLAVHHRIPFYVAAPLSTFDMTVEDGSGIVIEERPPEEITELFFKRRAAPRNVKVFNPAFDVTDHRLISAIVTERAIIRPPFVRSILRVMGTAGKTGKR